MIKKIVASFLVCCLLFSQISFSFGENEGSNGSERMIELFGEKKAQGIMGSIDTYMKKLSKNENNFLVSIKKISEKYNSLVKKQNLSQQEDKVLSVIEYILVQGYDMIIPLIYTGETLNQKEKSEIESKIIQLQKELFPYSESSFDVDSGFGIQGGINSEFRIDLESIEKMSGKIEFSDIIGVMKGIDSDIKGKLSIQSTTSGVPSSIKGNIHMIQKDNSSYIEVDGLEANVNPEGFLESIETSLKNIAEKKTFVKSDALSSDTTNIETLQKTFPILLKNLSKEALFTGYRKVGTTTILVPSQSFCQFAKTLSNQKSEPCSENEYDFLLEEYFDQGIIFSIENNGEKDIYSILGGENMTHIIGKVILEKNKIESIDIRITPDQQVFPKDTLAIVYKKNQLDIKMRGVGINFETQLIGDLKNNSGNYTLSIPEQGIISGTIEQKYSDKANGSISISANGKNLMDGKDSFSGKLSIDVKENSKVAFSLNGSYVQEGKEILGGSINYNISLTPKEASILAPKNWVKGDEESFE